MPKVVPKLPNKPDNHKEKDFSDDRIIKNITFFGDSSLTERHPDYILVKKVAKLLAENGYAIVNGGGPGIMKAATDGAEEVDGHTTAIYWEPKLASIFEGKNLANETDDSEAYSNYIMRTTGLIEKGHTYIVAKGGTGTLSELGLVWALAKLYYGKHKPVILLGEFWPELIKDMQKAFILDDNELGVLHFANSPEEVLDLVQGFELEVQSRTRKTYNGDETPFILAPKFTRDHQQRLIDNLRSQKNLIPNSLTKAQLEEFRGMIKPPARVLSIGLCSNYDIDFLSQKYSLTVIEDNPLKLRLAEFSTQNADIIDSSFERYEIQENVFKGIWSRDYLHHVNAENLSQVFKKIANGLVPGGIFMFIVREGDGDGYENDVENGENIKKYYNYFTSRMVEELAEQSGLEVVKITKQQRSHMWLQVILSKPN